MDLNKKRCGLKRNRNEESKQYFSLSQIIKEKLLNYKKKNMCMHPYTVQMGRHYRKHTD